ncbi:MAG TPA: DNA-3-methyladenine glycosylase, partial [Gaiellaceae bacterium]|nr:DNA-3-methyladenine glycosylase [Gaiellaceae bacterium]
RIVETESYHEVEPACHAFVGETDRTRVLLGPPGVAYVYRSYGIHWCLNLVCGEEGVAEAVLIRALEPTDGVETMRRRRGVTDVRALCSGPGKLCQALAITREHDGVPLDRPPFDLRPRESVPEIATGPRIGIAQATELSWRYALRGSNFLSRALRAGPA